MAEPRAAQAEQALSGAHTLRLTTTGRRSGTRHRVTVWFACAGPYVYLLAHAGPNRRGTDWYRNLRAVPGCVVEVEGLAVPGLAVQADDPSALEEQVRELFHDKYGPAAYAAWYANTPRLAVAIRLDLDLATTSEL